MDSTARFHMSLWVSDLDRSIAFYSEFFDMAPTKVREGYAKFEVARPSLNLALNQKKDSGTGGTLSHFGVQVFDREELVARHAHCKQKSLPVFIEHQTTCCHALQDKFWVSDPDGNDIEVFLVLEADVVQKDEDVFRGRTPKEPVCCG